MKTKEKKEIFAKTIKELRVLLNEAREALLNLKLEHAQNKLKNKRAIYSKKKEIARILTAVKEKELINNA